MVFVGGESIFTTLFRLFIFSSSLGIECGASGVTVEFDQNLTSVRY